MDTLKSYIREGEHQTQDFKFRIDDSKKIARTLAAFANTDGGRLLIGVKDNGKVTGINPEEEFHMIQAASEMYCKPIVPFTSHVWEEKHKLVLEIIVEESETKPHKSFDENGILKTYVRSKDHTLLANKILIGVWKEQKRKTAKPQEFGENEQLLLAQLEKYEKCTLSRLYKLMQIKKGNIDKLLILFICWELVKMEITEEGTFYSLK
jgi:predicted HTH transcriptional regulator